MKFSLFAIAALAAVTSSSCIVSATAAAAARKRKITKKVGCLSNSGSYGATELTDGDVIPIGESCLKSTANPNPICAVPAGLDHGVCFVRDECDGSTIGSCQSGQPGSFCGQSSDCNVQTDLNTPHAVCRGPSSSKCQRGVKGDYCDQDNDCL